MSMRDWLLKDDTKNKVGRPKLATEKLIFKSKIMIVVSLLLAALLFFSFICDVKNENPVEVIYYDTLVKFFGPIENKNGFSVKEKYDENHDYVMTFKIPSSIRKYNASYKYTTYYLKNNEWVKNSEEVIDTYEDDFKINFTSKRNENVTWKVKLGFVNLTSKTGDFSPGNWKFVQTKNEYSSYTYKEFTVKGYYSPINNSEYKEALKSKNKVYLTTDKKNPRKFTINMTGNENYSYKVKYTDAKGMQNDLEKKENLSGNTSFNIPNVDRTTKIEVRIWIDGYDKEALNDVKLFNWNVKTDSYGNNYMVNTYLVKPAAAYK